MRQWLALVLVGLLLLGAVPVPAQDTAGQAEVVELYRRAEALSQAGKLREAMQVYETTVEKARVAFGPADGTTANMMNNLALLYQALGEHAQGAALVSARSLAIYEAKNGKDHPLVAGSLNNLAGLYLALGQHEKARPLYLRSLEVREAKLGKDHPLVAGTLNDLAELYRVVGQPEKALPLYSRGIAIYEAKFGKDHPDVATSLNNLALLYQEIGQSDKAAALAPRSLAIWETNLGKDHPRVATALNNLADLYRDMGQQEKCAALVSAPFGDPRGQAGQGPPRRGGHAEQPGDSVPGNRPARQALPLFRAASTSSRPNSARTTTTSPSP